MRSYLVINTPGLIGQDRSVWALSGADDREVRAAVARLDEYALSPNDALDRWKAAIVLYDADTGVSDRLLSSPKYRRREEVRKYVIGSWSDRGAAVLCGLLSDRLGDLREELGFTLLVSYTGVGSGVRALTCASVRKDTLTRAIYRGRRDQMIAHAASSSACEARS
jgi:hypothetical protein